MAKPDKSYRKRKIGNHDLKPESLVMGYGFDPAMSEGSIKPPIFMTSTFAFKSARDGEVLFRQLAGKREEGDPEEADLIYTRFNNPNMEVLEDRLTLYDAGEDALVFSVRYGCHHDRASRLCGCWNNDPSFQPALWRHGSVHADLHAGLWRDPF